MKTAELTGLALDWAVTSIEVPEALTYGVADWREQRKRVAKHGEYLYRWSASWAQGGPLIEDEKISIEYFIDGGHADGGEWLATRISGPAVAEEYGPTPLVAAMRCFVASQLGDEIEIPPELQA